MPTLDWLTRDADLGASARVPVRLLRKEPALSAGEGDNGLLVQGDNLQALRALLPFYAGQVKCIYIDPPYNTRSAFEHYDDNLEHSKWLGMIVPRLMLLREFLSEDGSIWVSIDDNEGHYLKVVMDEVFGRRNFVRNIVWQKKYTVASDSLGIPDSHDHILVYRGSDKMQRGLLERTEKQNSLYKYDDGDGRGRYRTDNLSVKTYSEDYDYEIINPVTGVGYFPPQGRCWMTGPERMLELIQDNTVFFGRNGRGAPQLKRYLDRVQQGVVPTSWWPHEDAGHNDESRKEVKRLFAADAFSTPKPERLIQRILHIATNPGDLVLDSFLGSGTTAAVAHKMGRRWIGIEMGDHARTHCALRLRKVIEGEQGGISPDVGWQGGGGFRFATLGPAIYDADGVIAPDVRFADLARHVWFAETRRPLDGTPASPVLGVIHPAPPAPDPEAAPAPSPAAAAPDRAVALLFNGILRDRSPQGGNVLTRGTLALIRADLPQGFAGELVIYATACRLAPATLKAERITFRQTPYDLNAGGR